MACLYVESEAVSPDEIDGPWQEFNSTSGLWVEAADLKVSRGLPTLTFNDTHSVSRTVYADRGRLLMEVEGAALTRVRAVEFDPRYLRMVIQEDDLPATRSRDAAMASKYTEDTEEEEAMVSEDDGDGDGEGIEELESRAGDDDVSTGEEEATRVNVDTRAVEVLERALALQAFAREADTDAASKVDEKADEQVPDVSAQEVQADGSLKAGSAEPGTEGFDGEEGEATAEEEDDALGHGTQELVLNDVEAAVHFQMLCASLGVPFVLEGTQVAAAPVLRGAHLHVFWRVSCVREGQGPCRCSLCCVVCLSS